MSDLISRSALYAEIMEKEDLARERVLDTPTNSPCYMRYVAQLNERTALKHMIADAPTIEAVPVVHGKWIESDLLFEADKCTICKVSIYNTSGMNFCPNCGARMDGAE